MRFNVGDMVQICKDDLLRGGETARVLTVLDSNNQQSNRAYVVEFSVPPKRFRNDDRFLCCIYREEQLVRQQAGMSSIKVG